MKTTYKIQAHASPRHIEILAEYSNYGEASLHLTKLWQLFFRELEQHCEWDTGNSFFVGVWEREEWKKVYFSIATFSIG